MTVRPVLYPSLIFRKLNAMNVALKPLTESDLPLVADWLARPHVAQWWSGPGALEEIEYLLDSTNERGFIIVADGRPAGFIQAYNCYAQPDPIRDTKDPPETWGIDLFIGEETMLRRGIASAAIGAIVEILRKGSCTRLIIDPREDNVAAIALYRKVGFTEFAFIDDYPAPTHLMVRGMQPLAP
jgi:aminoglycoside 6'-N-acetyltransferase